ncbi:MAG: major capsid protein [Desulfobulbaceae bacterium]|nr:major capsid protein [Desulfobulbaceae bacterium]
MASLHSLTPNPTDPFSRWMVEMHDERNNIGVSTLFQSYFAKPGSQTLFSPDSNDVDIDIIKGNRKTAALVPRGAVSQTLGSLGKSTSAEQFKTFSRKFPLAEEMSEISANQLLFRQAGESPYQGLSRQQRMRGLAQRNHAEHMRRLIRLSEVLASQSILTGKMPAILGTTDTDYIYDFQRDATLTVTVANAWDSGSQTILADIDGICEKVRVLGFMNPDHIIMGEGAFAAFQDDTDIKALADNRRYEVVNINSSLTVPPNLQFLVDGGAQLRAVLQTPKGFKLHIFTYLDSYENTSAVDTKYMLTSEALIGSSQARCDRYFGPPERLPITSSEKMEFQELFGFNLDMPMQPPNIKNANAVVRPDAFYVDFYRSHGNKAVTQRIQYAPIFAPTHVNGFGVLNGLV